VTRADQAGLVVQDIARSSVIPKHRYKLDATTRAVIAISAKTPLAPGKPRRGAKNRTAALRRSGTRKAAKRRPN